MNQLRKLGLTSLTAIIVAVGMTLAFFPHSALATLIGGYSVNVVSLIPGTTATKLGKAEDAAHASGDTGVAALTRRIDTPASSAGSSGDYATLDTDANGRVYTFDVANAADGVSVASSLGATSTGTTDLNAAHTLFSAQACNGDSGTNVVKLYDKATAATNSDTPIARILVAAGSCNSITFPKGAKLANGLSIRAVAELTDSGTTGAAANKAIVNYTYK